MEKLLILSLLIIAFVIIIINTKLYYKRSQHKKIIFKSLEYGFASIALSCLILTLIIDISQDMKGGKIKEQHFEIVEKIQEEEPLNDTTLYTYLKDLRVPHKEIVFAQAKLESGNFTSDLCKVNNNIFGMRNSYKRPTVAEKGTNGYSYYKNWKYSVLDYLLWQQYSIVKELNETQYLQLLNRIYAEDMKYNKKIKEIIQTTDFESLIKDK